MSIQNPILLDLPLPIYTNRLLIRPMMPGDGKKIYALIEESRDQFEKWFTWTSTIKSWKDCEITAREFYAGFILRKTFAFLLFKEERLIGSVSFNDPNWSIPSAAIGYYARTSEQGKGYIREAVAAITKYAFKYIGFKRLEILCSDQNSKSYRVAESLGFQLETRAKGIISIPNSEELRFARRYVRFDADNLEPYTMEIRTEAFL